MRLRHQLQIALIAPLLVAVVASGVMTYSAFNRLNVSLVQSRLSFILANLRTTVESSLGLGLQLNQLPGAQDLIERVRAGDLQIRAIDIFDRSGRSLFSTDRGVIGEPVPAGWRAAASAAQTGHTWHLESHGDALFGLNIDNNLGQIVGSVAVTLMAADGRRRATAMARFIGLVSLIAAAIALLGTLTGGWWLGRRATRPMRQVERMLADDAAPPEHESGLAGLVVAARARSTEAQQALTAATTRLAAIDDDRSR